MSEPTISEIRTALMPLFAAITGITSVPAGRPTLLQDVDLPIVLLAPGESEYDSTLEAHALTDTRQWRAMVYVEEITGSEIEFDAEQRAEAFIPLFKQMLGEHERINTAQNYGVRVTAKGDSGAVILPYGEKKKYVGVVFRFTTRFSAAYQGGWPS